MKEMIKQSKKYKQLEKNLQQKYKNRRENEVDLSRDDFKDGKLSALGYFRLKQQCTHIDTFTEVEIKLDPDCAAFQEDLTETLEYLGSRELQQVKKDKRQNRTAALILMLGGILCFALSYGLSFIEHSLGVLNEIIIIASWVFVWGAIEKQFFASRELQDKRLKLLQIISAKITVRENPPAPTPLPPDAP
ncbi:MAG: hypothetical protein FWH03_08465 [Firmicutes bacterium]|nr:hypothetical protein [Bacillota bacterium]